MTAKLESLIKRELKIGRETYTVSMSPEGVKIALKGRRKGREISWETLLSGDAELTQQLKMSVDAYGADGRRVSAAPPPDAEIADAWRDAAARHARAASRAPRAHAPHRRARRKTPESGQPAYYVPDYAYRAGYEVIPVPVYYPEMRELFGNPVYRTLAAIPGDIDLVDVFRRPQDIPQARG